MKPKIPGIALPKGQRHYQYDIVNKSGRIKLPERQEPYWAPLSAGAALGYRKKAQGSWIVRWRDRTGKVRFESLGAHPDFNSARAAAVEVVTKMTASSRRTPARGTVRAALMSYVLHMRKIGRRATAQEARKRFALTVPAANDVKKIAVDPLRNMRLDAVTRDDMEEWRSRLSVGREPRSVNRQVRAVVAALNYAVDNGGYAGNPKAWKLTALTDEGEESTPVFLTAEQRTRIIATAPPALAALLTGYAHLGCRPSELEKAVVADFDAAGGTVTLRHKKGRGGKLRVRAVMLTKEGVAFFKEQARGKLPRAALIATDTGTHWDDQRRCGGIQKAIEAVNTAAKKPAQKIPAGASAYSFRHSRISELLQVYGIDPLTVAQQTGTSVAMIERSYFKFIASAMRDKLNAVKSA
jgi:integrase